MVVICFADSCFVSILVCNHLDGEERAGCFALFVFLVSRDGCVALPHDATDLSAVCVVVSPDYTLTILNSRLSLGKIGKDLNYIWRLGIVCPIIKPAF